jgi:predicted Zn-dependent peptidase
MVLATPHVREIERVRLQNGIRIVTESMPYVRSVSLGIWIGSGSRAERGAENGISHFIEHMVFKGTKNRSAEEIARSVDSVGGGLDAFTSKELVSFNTKVLDEHLPVAFDVLADLVQNPLFREADIEKEKGVILEEIKMEADQPEFVLHETFISNFWKGHPLGKPILGTKETVKKFTPELVNEFYSRIYAPSNILITAAGNLDHDDIVKLVRSKFEDFPERGGLPADLTPKAHAPLILKKKDSLEQVHITMGVPAYRLAHELRFPLYVLNTVLGGGMSSRLFQNIREKQGLAYAVYSELNLFSDTGCFTVYAGTAAETAKQVVTSVVQEFRNLNEALIGEDELRRAKDHLKGSLMLSLESTSSRMSNLARQELYFDRFMSLDEMLDSIESVTASEVQMVAQECFGSDNIALAMLGRLGELQVTREELAC